MIHTTFYLSFLLFIFNFSLTAFVHWNMKSWPFLKQKEYNALGLIFCIWEAWFAPNYAAGKQTKLENTKSRWTNIKHVDFLKEQ